ncbi:MAG: hypothetical protein MJK10_06395 [Pseudomonadales bacterium]|nr:hypothetical protein [Pseudomonadales bacterium]NRA14075.1 hypothetical protein [Oceanospirillaceae bacterium]
MTARTVTVYTVIHFLIAVTMWFLSISLVWAPADLSIFDHVYAFTVHWGLNILSFPAWWVLSLDLPGWASYLALPLQVLTSFMQINIGILLGGWCTSRNKKSSA